MTINITAEIKAAYDAYLTEPVDADFTGSTIRRRDTHPAAARVQKALALVESEPDTIGLHSAACELREALRTLGVQGTSGGQQ